MTPIYLVHALVTMQTALIVRVVFIKSVKQTTVLQEFKEFVLEIIHLIW